MNDAFNTTIILCAVIMSCAAVVGWCENIYKLCEYDTKIEFGVVPAVRMVGVIVPPLGSVAGYMTFDVERTPLMPIPLTRSGK